MQVLSRSSKEAAHSVSQHAEQTKPTGILRLQFFYIPTLSFSKVVASNHSAISSERPYKVPRWNRFINLCVTHIIASPPRFRRMLKYLPRRVPYPYTGKAHFRKQETINTTDKKRTPRALLPRRPRLSPLCLFWCPTATSSRSCNRLPKKAQPTRSFAGRSRQSSSSLMPATLEFSRALQLIEDEDSTLYLTLKEKQTKHLGDHYIYYQKTVCALRAIDSLSWSFFLLCNIFLHSLHFPCCWTEATSN